MARWGDEKTIHFICLYRKQECLWNTRSLFYKNKQSRENAYQGILQEFNDKNLDIKSIKTKIKNLRSVYHTELKKVKYTSRCGADGSVYKPSLSWFDEMHAFLGDNLEDRHDSTVNSEMDAPSTADNVISELKEADIEVITVEATFEPNLDPLQQTQTTEKTIIDVKPCAIISPPSSSRQQDLKPIKRKTFRRCRPYGDNTILNAIQRLENRVSNVINTNQQEIRMQTEDEFYMFALSVAAQLRQLPLHIAIATQSKIQSALSDARLASLFSDTLSPPTLSIKTEDTSN